jgi:hypothetical protein
MSTCVCGHELREREEPCSNDNCKGCAMCNSGILTIVWCENEKCPLRDMNEED